MMRRLLLILLIAIAFEALGADSIQTNPTDSSGAATVSSGGKIAQWLKSRGLSAEMAVIAVAALPIVELRGAIPVAMHLFDMKIPKSYVLSVIGNMLPIPFVILLLGPLSRVLRKIKLFDRFFTWLFARTEKRSESIKKYQELGLIIFIAIPLPMTGAWSGAMAAFLLGLRFWGSFFCALAGVCIAGVIVTAFSALGWIGAIAAAVILFAAATVSLLAKKPAKEQTN